MDVVGGDCNRSGDGGPGTKARTVYLVSCISRKGSRRAHVGETTKKPPTCANRGQIRATPHQHFVNKIMKLGLIGLGWGRLFFG